MKKNIVAICVICAAVARLCAAENDVLIGLDAYSRGEWSAAIQSFEKALVTQPDDRIESLYWLVMAEASAQNYRFALNYADAFLESAPADERAAEVSYQKGRILHLDGRYQESSDTLYRFLKDYPYHPKVPSAYYWIGENYYAAGSYADARAVFAEIIVNYPHSGKVNEARYKIVLIGQQAVRKELAQIVGETDAAQKKEAADMAESNADAAARAEEERSRDEEIARRLTALEKKLDSLAETLTRLSSEQEDRQVQEQQETETQKQEEAKRQEQEKRQKELKELQQRTRTLEKIYEQRVKGAK